MKTVFKFLLVFFLLISMDLRSQTPSLFVTTTAGGEYNLGAILKSDSAGINFHVVHSLDDILTGAFPLDNLLDAGNGKLYGVTLLGGTTGSCVIYTFDTLTNSYTANFDFYDPFTFGYAPFSGMVKGQDGKFYGLTVGGGSGSSVIYCLDPTDDSYHPLKKFNDTTGINPEGRMLLSNNGKFYGMTTGGGNLNKGVIFDFNPSDTSYNVLHQFNDTVGGQEPIYSNFIQAVDGKLYSMTYSGGENYHGVIFQFDPMNNEYTDLFLFDSIHGANPVGSLIQASDGKLYGLTDKGGIYDKGVLFCYDISSSVFTLLHQFNGNDGANPRRSLTQASNGKIFGTTYNGGTDLLGVIFSYDIFSQEYQVVLNFNGTNGAHPDAEVNEIGARKILHVFLEDYSDKQLNISPNPVSNNIYLSGINSNKFSNYFIYDLYGKELIKSEFSDNRINVSSLLPGVYIIKLLSNNKVYQKKFIKK